MNGRHLFEVREHDGWAEVVVDNPPVVMDWHLLGTWRELLTKLAATHWCKAVKLMRQPDDPLLSAPLWLADLAWDSFGIRLLNECPTALLREARRRAEGHRFAVIGHDGWVEVMIDNECPGNWNFIGLAEEFVAELKRREGRDGRYVCCSRYLSDGSYEHLVPVLPPEYLTRELDRAGVLYDNDMKIVERLSLLLWSMERQWREGPGAELADRIEEVRKEYATMRSRVLPVLEAMDAIIEQAARAT